MEVKSSSRIAQKKPLLKKLLGMLLEKYEYASILMNNDYGKSYNISKMGINISQDFFAECGYVLKVYDGESYGEYSFNQIEEGDLIRILQMVDEKLIPWKEQLPEGLSVKKYPVMPDEEVIFEKSTEYEIDPEEMGDEKILQYVQQLREKTLAMEEKLTDCSVSASYTIYHKLFLSPKKEMIQNIMYTAAYVSVRQTAESTDSGADGQMYMAMASCSGCGGMEIVDGLEEKIPATLDTLRGLLTSTAITPGEYDCICSPEMTGMIVHEAFGHGVEMDMFVKNRAMAVDYIGKQVASPLVTMHDGAGVTSQTAKFFFDDEGTLAQDTIIIDHGILKTGICDAQAAMALGTVPTGNGRRQGTNHKAYTRMTNTFFEPGSDKLEDMIASIKYGFYLEQACSGMEDPKNWGIQCMLDVAKEIKDGKFTGKVFSPVVLSGYVPDLLKSITMISDTSELAGVGLCGKGYKEWVNVSDGGPCIKAKIRLG